jgi:HK97 family phage prohead protease
MKQELRTLNVAIRAAAKDDLFELHGTALSYNVLSQDLGGFRERIAPGCFTRALADKATDVRMLFNHSQNHVLGRQSNGTLQLFDTPEGLNFCCKLDPNQQAHRDLHSSIKRGDIYDCSVVTTPAYNAPGATSVVARSGTVIPTRRNEKSLEQQFFDKHGRWPILDQDLRAKAARLGAQIRRDAAVIKGDEQLRARVEEAGRRIRIEALIAEMEEMVNG